MYSFSCVFSKSRCFSVPSIIKNGHGCVDQYCICIVIVIPVASVQVPLTHFKSIVQVNIHSYGITYLMTALYFRYLSKTFQQALAYTRPDMIIFLGDLFDEGKCNDQEFKLTYARFNSIFRAPPKIKVKLDSI